MNYSWRIVKLGLQDELNHEGVLLENAIVNIKWKRVAVDTDGTEASYVGNTKLSSKSVDSDSFVALNSVTNTMATGWVESSMTQKKIETIDANLAIKVERNRVQTVRPSW